MDICLRQEPTNSALSKYRGLYRQNNIIDFCESTNPNLIKTIDWYFSFSKEGGHIEYTERNKIQLLSLHNMLKTEKWSGEVIVFTDSVEIDIPDDCEFVGYDICADSKYYSPIGDGILEAYDRNELFFAEMSATEFKDYKNNINDNGLFSSYSVALKFSQYCNEINEHYEHAVESENNWRPFAVYTLRQ